MFSANSSQVVATSTQAEAVDFDGTNDYLTRASDFDGNADGKTFTFSAWVYVSAYTGGYAPILQSQGSRVDIYIDNSGRINLLMMNSAGTTVLNAFSQSPSDVPFAINTFNNILVSVDLSSTAKKFMYVNDVSIPFGYSTYTNANIDFTNTNYRVGYGASGPLKLKGRLSNVFLDYTYRDLSVEANRRLFVTADLKPAAGQAALNPILYLPMSDPTTVATNAGTGGNFTLTGTVERSGRGPNQYNVPYSTFDGSVDYLSRTTAPTGIADGKQFTLAFCFNAASVASDFDILTFSTSTTYRFRVRLAGGGVPDILINAYSSAGTQILSSALNVSDLAANRNYVVVLSYDMSSSALRRAYVNGVATAISASVYTNSNIDFAITSTPRYYIGASPTPSLYWNGQLGALWFNTSYIDLSVASNLAKFVSGTGIDAKPVDLGATGELPTGTSPLIYLPMYGGNAGKNYGTGGDFTVNSGPYTGARGPNEFLGNAADFAGDLDSTTRLTRTTGVGLSDGKTFSMSFWFNPNNSESGDFIFNIGNDKFGVRRDTSNQFNFYAGSVLNATSNSTIPTDNVWYHVLVCIDLTSTAKRFVYINGTAYTMTWSAYSNSNIGFSGQYYTIGGYWDGSYYPASAFNGKISEFYFTTDYIDFSLESNRLKFRDCFGNPTDLPSAITALSIPNPAIYLRFPPTSFGTNSGTGGDFSSSGRITDGGQL